MKITGLLPVRNEEWIIGFSLRAHLMWMDDLIVLNHASTDRTKDILEQIRSEVGNDRLMIVDHPDPVWRDTTQRQMLLELGRQQGGEYFALFDADEVLTGNLLPQIRSIVNSLKPAECVTIPWIPIWKAISQYRTHHVTEGATIAFCDAPLLHWRSEQGYDQHRRHPYESVHVPQPKVSGGGMHFQFADWPRVVAKHALYVMVETVRFPNRRTPAQLNEQYGATIDDRGSEVAPTPFEWFAPYGEILKHLQLGLEPWHVAECRRLWELHGPKKFQGLNLYGVLPSTEQSTPMVQLAQAAYETRQPHSQTGHIRMTLTQKNRLKRLGLQRGTA